MNTLFRSRQAIATAVALVALLTAGLIAPRAAAAQSNAPDWGAVSGVRNDRGPVRSTFSAYTVIQGTSDEFLQPNVDADDWDRWTADFVISAEIKLPAIDLSIFGDINYRYVASGSEINTGWGDATLGAKLDLVRNNTVALGIWGSGTLPVGDKDVRIADYKAGHIGIGASFAPIQWVFFNTSAEFGSIWELENPLTQESIDSLEIKLGFEAGILIPGGLGSGRIGVEGFYRENSFDKASFLAYLEGHISVFFLRVAIPFDVDDGIAGVENGFYNAELTVFLGVSIGLPEF